MRNKLPADQQLQYNALPDAAHKRAWLAKFILDPTCATLSGSNTFTRETEDVEGVDFVWITLSTMGGPSYLNNPEEAKLVAQDCASRPHSRSPTAAAAGVLEYKYYMDRGSHSQTKRDSSSVSAASDLTADDYSRIRAAMGEDATSAHAAEPLPKKSKGDAAARKLENEAKHKAKLEAMTAEERAQYDHDNAAGDKLRDTVRWVEKERTALKKVDTVRTLLKGKGKWGIEAAKSLESTSDQALTAVEKVFTAYNTALALPFPAVGDEAKTAQYASKLAELVALKTASMAIVDAFKPQLRDFAKLSGQGA